MQELGARATDVKVRLQGEFFTSVFSPLPLKPQSELHRVTINMYMCIVVLEQYGCPPRGPRLRREPNFWQA